MLTGDPNSQATQHSWNRKWLRSFVVFVNCVCVYMCAKICVFVDVEYLCFEFVLNLSCGFCVWCAFQFNKQQNHCKRHDKRMTNCHAFAMAMRLPNAHKDEWMNVL